LWFQLVSSTLIVYFLTIGVLLPPIVIFSFLLCGLASLESNHPSFFSHFFFGFWLFCFLPFCFFVFVIMRLPFIISLQVGRKLADKTKDEIMTEVLRVFACLDVKAVQVAHRPKDLPTSMSTTTTSKSCSDGKGAKTAGGRCHWKPQSQSCIQVVKLVSSIPSWPRSTGIFSSGRTETESNHKSSGRKQRKSLPKDYRCLKVACWNIRPMLDWADSSRPERRSALVAHELSRLDVDIAALSKVRFPEEGCLKEQGAGYTIYWSGKPSTEKRLSGVGFMVRNSIVSKLETLPSRHSDRIVSMRLPARWTSNNTSHSSVFSPLLFRQNLQKRNDSTPTFGGYCKAPPQRTSYWSLVTSTPELVETLKPGKESLRDMALQTATTTGAYC